MRLKLWVGGSSTLNILYKNIIYKNIEAQIMIFLQNKIKNITK